MIKIAIIIPTFNRRKPLSHVLKQLQKIDDAGFQLSIFVVVDGSTDGTIEMLKGEFSNVITIIGDGNWWYTKSMNEGFKLAQAHNPDYFLLLNDDMHFETDFVAILLKAALEKNNNAIITSICFSDKAPFLLFNSGVKRISWWRSKFFRYHLALSKGSPKDFTGLVRTEAITGRGTIIPSNILYRLNMYDEKFVQYGSDLDLGFKAIKNGYECYISWDAKVFSMIELTGKGATFIKSDFSSFIKNMFNEHSMTYLPDAFRLVWRYGPRWLFPLSCTIIVLGTFKSYFFNRKY